MRASASRRRASRRSGRGRGWRPEGLRGCLRCTARKVSATSLLSLLRRGRTSPARSCVVEEGEGGEGLGAGEARRGGPRPSACGSPLPRRRRRTASMQAASRARRQRPGTTRRRPRAGGRRSGRGPSRPRCSARRGPWRGGARRAEPSRRVTSMTVAAMPRRRTASGRRSSWVKTTTWRSLRGGLRGRGRGRRLRAGSMDWTGSSMTTKRNGLSGRVARGMKRLRARACSSPWLMTPRAAPSGPSTVTSSSTCAPGAGAGEVDVVEGDVALEAELVPDGLGLVVDRGEALVADVVGRVLEPLLGGLQGREGLGGLCGPSWPSGASRRGPGRGGASGLRGLRGLGSGLLSGVASTARRTLVDGVDESRRGRCRVPPLSARTGRSCEVTQGRCRPGRRGRLSWPSSRSSSGDGQRALRASLVRPSSACRRLRRFARGLPQALGFLGLAAGASRCRARSSCRRRGSRRRRGPCGSGGRGRGGWRGRRTSPPRSGRRLASGAAAASRRALTDGGDGVRVGGLEDGQALQDVEVAVRLAARRRSGQDGLERRQAPVLLSERFPDASRRARRSSSRAGRGAVLRSWSASFCALSRVVRACGGRSARPRGRRGRGSSRGRRRASTGPRRASSRARCRRGRGGRLASGVVPAEGVLRRCAACRGPGPRWWRRRGRRRPPTRGRRCRCPSRPRARTRRRARPSVVEVAPAVAPDLAAVLPAVGVAGEEQLEGLGEAGLAGAVAADDEGEAGAGGEVEGGLRADAAEAFDGDGAEEGDSGGAGGATDADDGGSLAAPAREPVGGSG